MNREKSDQRKFDENIKKMFKWALMKAFNDYETAVASPDSLKKLIQEVWDECVDDGDIVVFSEEK